MGAFDFKHESSLDEDIAAVRHAAIERMDKDPAWSRQLLHVATAAAAWGTLLSDPQVQRRYTAPRWTGYASAAALVIALLSFAVALLRF